VKRAPHAPGADNRAILDQSAFDIRGVEAGSPGAYPQRGGACILRLDATELSNHLRDGARTAGPLRGEMLCVQAKLEGLVFGQRNGRNFYEGRPWRHSGSPVKVTGAREARAR
jgi:hypothetical protein